MEKPLFVRYEKNPILTAEGWPYAVHSVFNAGVTRCGDDVVLLVRCEDYSGVSHLCVARSKNGKDGWEIDKAPTFVADPDGFREEIWGVEDPRITYVPEIKKWIVAYTAFSENGPLVALAETKDFKTFKRYGAALLPENKDAALFPERLNGEWIMIHRPVSGVPPAANMWISSSPDLIHWGRHQVLLTTRPGPFWDAVGIRDGNVIAITVLLINR